MAKDNLGANSGDGLRSRAGSKLADVAVDLQSMPLENIQELVNELQDREVEIGMQNKKLGRAQAEIQEARTKYADLY
jgi:hypothetical protein